MSDRILSVGLTAFLLVLVAAMTWLALDFNEQARRIPLAVGLPTITFLVLQLTRELLALRLGPAVSDAKEVDDEAEEGTTTAEADTGESPREEDAAPAAQRGRAAVATESGPDRSGTPNRASALQAFAWVLGLAVSFYVFGMMLTVPVFMGVFMKVYGREPWRTVVLMVLATMAILYAFFVRLLEVQLYPGIVGEWLGL